MVFLFGLAYFSFGCLKEFLEKNYSLSVFDGLSSEEMEDLEDFSYSIKKDGNIYASNGVNEWLFIEFV